MSVSTARVDVTERKKTSSIRAKTKGSLCPTGSRNLLCNFRTRAWQRRKSLESRRISRVADLAPFSPPVRLKPAPVVAASSQCDPEPAASDCDPIPAPQALILEERPRLNSWQMHDPSACLPNGLVWVWFGSSSRFDTDALVVNSNGME